MATGSLINSIYESSRPKDPTVGMGATALYWSDRHAGTITEVSPSGKQITWQSDTATRTDSHGMSDAQSYSYAPNPNGTVLVFTLRKNGKWVQQGESMTGGLKLAVGIRDEHYDYSF